MVTLPMCRSFFVIWRSCTHSSERLKMRYESLRNVAMHFKAFKCVKNAFHSSAVVTLLLFELRMCGAMTLISSRITSKRLLCSSRRTKRPWLISILGLLLYLIYINDFHNCSKRKVTICLLCFSLLSIPCEIMSFIGPRKSIDLLTI